MICFVIGMPGVGKSTYIKENFKNEIIMDIFEYQNKYGVIEGYYKMMNDLKNIIVSPERRDKSIIVEHTLLRKQRRKEYIDAIRAVSDEDIVLVFIDKNDNKIYQQMLKRYKETEPDIDKRTMENIKKQINAHRSLLEKPTSDEEFSKIIFK